MQRHWNDHELALHWWLATDELAVLPPGEPSSRLGVAASLKFFQLEGRFPSSVKLTFRTPSEGDPRIFPWAFFARTAPPTRGMLASPERRYTKRLHPGRVLWVSCYRPSKRTKSNICPL